MKNDDYTYLHHAKKKAEAPWENHENVPKKKDESGGSGFLKGLTFLLAVICPFAGKACRKSDAGEIVGKIIGKAVVKPNTNKLLDEKESRDLDDIMKQIKQNIEEQKNAESQDRTRNY